MKIWGVSMVRNEEDIVEAFVCHNLSILDGLFVVDHLSSDRTVDILRDLCAERLPLVVTRNESPGYLQAEIMTTAARELFARAGADVVIPLDADEFLHAASRERLERVLAAIPPGHVGRLTWPTFLPTFDPPPADMISLLRGARRLAHEAQPPDVRAGKAAMPRAIAGLPDASFVTGSHRILVGRGKAARPLPHVDLDPAIARLCHVPVRSRTQYVVKTAVSHLALMAADRWFLSNSTRRHEYERLRGGGTLEPQTMLRNYTVGPVETGRVDRVMPETVVDPFLAPIELRYSGGVPVDPLPQVLSAVEQMTRRVADATRKRRDTAKP